MSRMYELRWDSTRPVLHEVLKAGMWSDEEHLAYLSDLRDLLKDAPAGGFDVLSDARDDTIQESGTSDHESYTMLAEAGAKRFVQVVRQAVLAMQTQRMIREAGLASRLTYTWVTSPEDAEKILREA